MRESLKKTRSSPADSCYSKIQQNNHHHGPEGASYSQANIFKSHGIWLDYGECTLSFKSKPLVFFAW